MEEKFVSEIKRIPHKAEHIYGMLSDLSNLERVKDRIPAGKVKDFTFDSDSCSVSVDPVGKICFQIVEREPNQLLKFAATNSPIPLHLWIQLKEVGEGATGMNLTVGAELNPFIKQMVAKPLQEAIDKMAEVLTVLPY